MRDIECVLLLIECVLFLIECVLLLMHLKHAFVLARSSYGENRYYLRVACISISGQRDLLIVTGKRDSCGKREPVAAKKTCWVFFAGYNLQVGCIFAYVLAYAH